MKPEIQQVLKMNKEGKLTDDQAAELLAELASNHSGAGASAGANAGTGAREDWLHGEFVKPIVSKVNETLKTALDAALGPAETDQNTVRMSRCDTPDGREYEFQRNVIRMSALKKLRLNQAVMTDNTVDMSKMDGLILRNAKLTQSEVRASSADDWSIDNTEVTGLIVLGSKFNQFRAEGRSDLSGVKIQGSSVKGLRAEDAVKMAHFLCNGCSLSDVKFRRATLTDSEFQASNINGLMIDDCRFSNALLRGMNVRHAVFTACEFADVFFSGLETWGWKKRGLDAVRFEACKLNKVLFSNCRLSKAVIKNVNLSDRKFQDLDLSGLTLDGNDAFLAAVEGKK